jgi:diguanylate cyclase (GGDEF)-like protein
VALAGIRRTLYINLAISLAVTLVVMLLTHLVLSRYQRRMEEMAATDKLTGLLNRQASAIVVDKVMAEYRREPRPVSVLLADVDHFKEINDRHGHLAGDAALRSVAETLHGGLRGSDIAVRWGGEEFLLMLRGCDLSEAEWIAEKLRAAVEQAPLGERGLRTTISIGVAEYDGKETADHWFNRADAALYRAKNAGRNRVVADPAAAAAGS